MRYFNVPTSRHGALLAPILVAALAVIAPAARAAATPTPTATPVAVATPAPAPAPAPPAVRVLALPVHPTSNAIQRLAAELRAAGVSTLVIVHTEGPPQLAGSVSERALGELADAARSARLGVAGDAGTYASFRGAGVPFEAVASSTLAAAPDDGGRGPLILAIVGALVLAILAAAASMRQRAAAGGPATPPERRVAPAPPPRPAPAPRQRSRRPPARDDASFPAQGRALVRSTLQPEGYVEIASCLRRARWAEPRTEPPAPGQWVHVEVERGRLVALPSNRPRKGEPR